MFKLAAKCLTELIRVNHTLPTSFLSFLFFVIFLTLLIFSSAFAVSSAPEVIIHNGHFSWKKQDETGQEDEGTIFSTAGELTTINLCVETVRALSYTGQFML